MRVLVTGLSGFVGTALGPALSERNHEVRALPRAELAPQHFAGGEAVVHLANIAEPRTERSVLWDVNVGGTRRTAEAAARAGVRRFLYVSSIKAGSADYYGTTKLHAERALAEVSAGSGMEIVVLRPPLLYGAGVRGSFLWLLKAIASGWPLPFGSIRNRRSVLYVGNLANAIVLCIERVEARGRTYALSDGVALSTPDLCRALGQALGRPAKLFSFPVFPLKGFARTRGLAESLEIDDSAIRTEIRWKPPYSLEQGIRETAHWYLNR
jgi:nucleoside-diphosphate-sugar epimerase